MYLNSQEKTADLLYKAVKRAVVSPSAILTGDLIVVTDKDTDIVLDKLVCKNAEIYVQVLENQSYSQNYQILTIQTC